MPVALKMDSANKKISPDDRVNMTIAKRSSVNVVPMGPSARVLQFPFPQGLEMALELDKEDPKLTESAKTYSAILEYMPNLKDIKPEHYWFFMKLILYLDHHQNKLDMEEYSLHAQKIVPSKYMSNNFVIRVPGLSEDRPSVRNKDLVIINQTNGTNSTVGIVSSVGANYITAIVCGEFVKAFQPDHLYDITFEYPDYCFRCCHHAVDRSLEFQLLPMLFPLENPIKKIQKQQEFLWTNENIKSNPEQQQAVINIMARTAFPAPYILFGPPGTGKTSTLVEAVGQILKKNPSNRILICTPSNAAADEVALRLLKHSIDTCDIHRMYSMSRDSKDICETLKECSNFSGTQITYINGQMLRMKKIVIVTLLTCHRLVEYKLRENHFSYVFVDEAGQATEPETLIPVTLMSSSDRSHKGRLHGQLVIAGDPQQLGPSIRSKTAERLLGCSMLERLMNWKLYKKDHNNKYNPHYVTKLVRNYRSHSAILHIPNQLFYGSELIAIGGAHTERAVDWNKLPKPKFPVIFHAVSGKEGRESRSPSVFNAQEIGITMSYLEELLRSKLGGRTVRQEDIGIVTPYKLQRQKIHEMLGNKNWNDVEIGTVETFQGQEKDIIIISTVRSVLYTHNGGLHLGFLSNPKRFNVALTRAKALLIVIGNPAVLQYDANWFSLISYCVENGAVRGSKFSLDPRPNWSRVRKLLGQKHVPTPECDANMPFQVVEEAPVVKKSFPLPQDISERRRRVPKGDSACEESPATNASPVDSFASSPLHSYLINGHPSLRNGTKVNGAVSEDSEEWGFLRGLFSDEEQSEASDLIFDSNEITNDSGNSTTSSSGNSTTRSSTPIERSSRSPSRNGVAVPKISSSISSKSMNTKSTGRSKN